VTAAVRLFFVGGLTSYRALFYWLSPTIYIPSLVVAPIFQILLFAYVGRSAGLETDKFYVIGNAIQYAAIPCLFAMSQLISGERFQNTLSAILVSPASRIPLFFGRALPVIANAAFVSAFSLTAGCLILGVDLPGSSIPGLAVTIAIAAFSCTGLGLINAAVSLRVRENAVLSNVIFGFLLIFTGANVPLDELPNWMSAISHGLPFTHAIAAARELADGASFASVADTLGTEVLIGLIYLVVGYAMLRFFEWQGRKHATLERA
jgi:ABC-2 type transport system permease protein